jgi:hypothetical protein
MLNQVSTAELLFEYIALFRPSDLMFSDMGKEFVAQVVQQLYENFLIQHTQLSLTILVQMV